MSLKVIGAGWSRTGTFSLRQALQLLGTARTAVRALAGVQSLGRLGTPVRVSRRAAAGGAISQDQRARAVPAPRGAGPMSGGELLRSDCADRLRADRLRRCWLLACLLVACGGATREPPPGWDVVHTPPPNADSLQRVSVQLSYESGPEVPGLPEKPLGGWKIEARWTGDGRASAGVPDFNVAAEAVERTDLSGVAVFWLEHARAYEFWLVDQHRAEESCWWWGRAQWEGESSDVMLQLSLACS